MSSNWVEDIKIMHQKYQVESAVNKMDAEKLKAFLQFRINFLQEELDELKKSDNPKEVVDALIDLCVVAIGTLDAFKVNSYLAWDTVLQANMKKEVGVKTERPNPLGLPDLIKPIGWTAPSHEKNTGLFDKVF